MIDLQSFMSFIFSASPRARREGILFSTIKDFDIKDAAKRDLCRFSYLYSPVKRMGCPNTLFTTCHDGPCTPVTLRSTSSRDPSILWFVQTTGARPTNQGPRLCEGYGQAEAHIHTSSLASTSCRVSFHKEGNTEMKSGGRIRNWPRYQRALGKRGVMQYHLRFRGRCLAE
ncbi:hypothetical protein BC827DRAFT_911034 [Russula dissimulans]|nr:hypothetical protein BC827DRAFT_911034 [Russula dissimulans]